MREANFQKAWTRALSPVSTQRKNRNRIRLFWVSPRGSAGRAGRMGGAGRPGGRPKDGAVGPKRSSNGGKAMESAESLEWPPMIRIEFFVNSLDTNTPLMTAVSHWGHCGV